MIKITEPTIELFEKLGYQYVYAPGSDTLLPKLMGGEVRVHL